MKRFVFTCGDVNGIGPEIVIKTLNKIAANPNEKYALIIPQNVFDDIANKIKPDFICEFQNNSDTFTNSAVTIIPLENCSLNYGEITPEAGLSAFNSIKKGFDLVYNKKADVLITAPISKKAFSLAGIKYPGHTEMIAEWSNTKNFMMLFLSEKMNASLVTIHEPIKEVVSKLTSDKLISTIDVSLDTLINELGIVNPTIAVLGLNPHAGEGGVIGDEEQRLISPVINSHQFKKHLFGPFSPDAFFANHLYKNYDLIIGMYHDQILIPFKMLNSGYGVNYTAGLPIIRTSPDHGTAFDIAGKNIADETSILQAYKYSKIILENRKKNATTN